MNDWREKILSFFVCDIHKLLLVADPDGLLTEEKISHTLHRNGWTIIDYRNAIEFRFAFESKFRSPWERGEPVNLVVLVQGTESDLWPIPWPIRGRRALSLESLPYDLLQTGKLLHFSIADIFPYLDTAVVETLDHGLLDRLFLVQCDLPQTHLGENATKDMILRSVFEIEPEHITEPYELLQVLLHRHYDGVVIPQILEERWIQLLKKGGKFTDWPLEQIIPHSPAFYAFLQERWPIFLENRDQLKECAEEWHFRAIPVSLAFSGPSSLPFENSSVRVFMNQLFVEGKLTAVSLASSALNGEIPHWMRFGIVDTREAENPEKDQRERLLALFQSIDPKGISTDTKYHYDASRQWSLFAWKWAQLSALMHTLQNQQEFPRFQEMQQQINNRFRDWMKENVSSLMLQSPVEPVMVHHLARNLKRKMETQHASRIALLVMDGLALDQWITLRSILKEQNRELSMSESTLFAWIPTMTSVSRQALFSGNLPLYFPSSIHSTQSEESLWKQFWEQEGIPRSEIAYTLMSTAPEGARISDTAVVPSKTRVVGLIVDKIDQIAHGMKLGAAGMHNQIRLWGQTGYLSLLIKDLLDTGFDLWLTSDHGNIECRGIGRAKEGVIAEGRGERVRIYTTHEQCSASCAAIPSSMQWPTSGLPQKYFPLVAPVSGGFIPLDEIAVTHGGVSIEEVIVPLIHIERRTQDGSTV